MAYTTIDDPTAYFQTTLYSGTGSQQSITNGGNSDLQPDWLWIKERDATSSHQLVDSVRGYYLRVESNNTSAELDAGQTGATYQNVTSFDSDGFGVKNGGAVNESGKTYVAWNWKAGTSFTNDASATGIGTIDSTGSASTAAGFSIVSYTGTGSAGTIKHGLSSIPKMIIMKTRSTSNIWSVYHVGLGNTHYMQLNEPDTATDNDTYWSDTTPTSSVFSVGTASGVNGNGVTNIAYCFADVQGYSKITDYLGNGDANGPYIHLGFSPAFIIIKKYGSGAWNIKDNRRRTASVSTGGNLTEAVLLANSTAADQDANGIDFTANGFKIKSTGGDVNTANNAYIYMAFAEEPFVASNFNTATAR